MRFLLDQNLSPRIGPWLSDAGHDAVHVRDLRQSSASDRALVELARQQQRTIISADTDFGELLAQINASSPSFVLLRRQDRRRAGQIAALLLANLKWSSTTSKPAPSSCSTTPEFESDTYPFGPPDRRQMHADVAHAFARPSCGHLKRQPPSCGLPCRRRGARQRAGNASPQLAEKPRGADNPSRHPADLNSEDETGLVWTSLDEATDPGSHPPSEIVDKPAGPIVRLRILPGAHGQHRRLIDRVDA